jgi:hypothetical protein
MRVGHGFGSPLSLSLILGLQSRLIGLDKLPKLSSVREQRVPLLQVEGDREATETVHRNSALFRDFNDDPINQSRRIQSIRP